MITLPSPLKTIQQLQTVSSQKLHFIKFVFLTRISASHRHNNSFLVARFFSSLPPQRQRHLVRNGCLANSPVQVKIFTSVEQVRQARQRKHNNNNGNSMNSEILNTSKNAATTTTAAAASLALSQRRTFLQLLRRFAVFEKNSISSK